MMGTHREKENGGALDIPGGGRLIELEYASVADRKLRSQLRNVSDLELQAPLPPPSPRPCPSSVRTRSQWFVIPSSRCQCGWRREVATWALQFKQVRLKM